MNRKETFWVLVIPILAILLIRAFGPQAMQFSLGDREDRLAAAAVLQTSTDIETSETTPQNDSSSGAALPQERNPGLVVGAVLIVSIVVIGVLGYSAKQHHVTTS